MDEDQIARTLRNLQPIPRHISPAQTCERREPIAEPEEPKPTSAFARNFEQRLAEHAANTEKAFDFIASFLGEETGVLKRELEALRITVEDLRAEVSLLRTVARTKGVPITGANGHAD